MTEQLPPPRWWHRVIQSSAATPLGSRLLAGTLHKLDRPFLRISGGKFSLTGFLAGLPVVEVTTIGANSGAPRKVPLAAVFDGDKVVLYATFFGSKRHPAWYHNLVANPHATVSINGEEHTCLAREANPAERARYWQRALETYPGYAVYQIRAGGRIIPVIVLEPET